MDIERVCSPEALKELSGSQLSELASQLRRELIDLVSDSGGHLGPNLGIVELTIAIHRVFESPSDPVIFDTGHQSYVHKMLTGRRSLAGLRTRGGIAGYPQRSESPHDIVENSHASGSLSWADGISRGLTLAGKTDRTVVAVIGDGALTGGMAWEALNNISHDNSRPIVIVINDNTRSYAPTIGGAAKSLASATQAESKEHGPNGPGFLTALGLHYLGPIDGHDIEALESALQQAKSMRRPVVVHAITEKGHGFQPAVEDEADQFHAVGKIDSVTGDPRTVQVARSWTDVFAEELLAIASENPKVLAITGAMLLPTGLGPMAERFPQRVVDVGIAEQHATASAAGLAYAGYHPIVAIYSTFLNRAFDQLLLDVSLHNAGVTFVLDRSGVTGPDGASHHGIWDVSLVSGVPGIHLAAPRDEQRLRYALRDCVKINDAPSIIRFPKGSVSGEIPSLESRSGMDILFQNGEGGVLLIAGGAMVNLGVEVAEQLMERGISSTVVDPIWLAPINPALAEMAKGFELVATLEDGLVRGGFGSSLVQAIAEAGSHTPTVNFGLPQEFLEHAERSEILTRLELEASSLAERIRTRLEHLR